MATLKCDKMEEKMDDSEIDLAVQKPQSPQKAPTFKDYSISSTQIFWDMEIDEVFSAVKSLDDSQEKTGDNSVEKIECDTILEKGASEISPPDKNESPFVSAAIEESQKSRTENYAPTFSTSGDARVDFFFHVLEQTETEKTKEMLKRSWRQHSLHTLKLVGILRDVRGGKGIRRQYQDCLYWMYINHPKTLYKNLEELLQLGYWKDSLEMLMVIIFDGVIHPFLSYDDVGRNMAPSNDNKETQNSRKRNNPEKRTDINYHEKEFYNNLIKKHYKQQDTKKDKHEMNALRTQFAREKFQSDTKYRLFHLRIAQIFASQLKMDLENVEKKKKEVSLAGKWAPSIEAHFDRYTLIASTISVELVKILKDKSDILLKPVPLAVYLSRRIYHKEYCVPLRKYHEIPEIAMSAGQWDQVNYKRVPAKCMKRNKKSFIKHDQERFQQFLIKPESKVAGATLKPVEIFHEILSLSNDSAEEEKTVIEKQWISLVEDIKKKGGSLLKNAVAICDVSGSMCGQPMEAAIGLTLITMRLCEQPWNKVCITFSEQPKFHHLDEELSLIEKVNSLREMEWGGNTDVQKVFQLVVDMGVKNKLSQDQMPKVLFIFSDMEFDEACPGTSETNFEAAKRSFQENGYTLPTIVFWNLRGGKRSTSTPVRTNEHGVLLLSGFSAQQLSYVMEKDDISKCTPLQFVLDVIENKKYSNLVIYD